MVPNFHFDLGLNHSHKKLISLKPIKEKQVINDVNPVAWYAKVGKKMYIDFSKHILHDLLMNLHLHIMIPTFPFKLTYDDHPLSIRNHEKKNDVAYIKQFIEELKRYDPLDPKYLLTFSTTCFNCFILIVSHVIMP